ncbi:hypothetical protein GVAV_002077 [Gurleya vavrai]
MIFIFIFSKIYSKDLFYIKLYDKNSNFYINDEWINMPIRLTKKKDKAKKFWVEQDKENERKVKIHCGEEGEHVITLNDNEDIVFSEDLKSKKKDQYFVASKADGYKKEKKFVYLFKMKDKFLTYDDGLIFLKPKNEEFENQRFEFVNTKKNKKIEPIKFEPKKIERKEEKEINSSSENENNNEKSNITYYEKLKIAEYIAENFIKDDKSNK